MRTHQPIRTCIGCGRKADKYELLRLVRTSDGTVEPDPESRKSGRGAYLCYNPDCFSKALQRHAIQRHLGVTPPKNFPEELNRILNVEN